MAHISTTLVGDVTKIHAFIVDLVPDKDTQRMTESDLAAAVELLCAQLSVEGKRPCGAFPATVYVRQSMGSVPEQRIVILVEPK